MARIYFDVTDVVEYAKKNNTVTGIQRVQLNIISLLARKHGGDLVRCVFLDLQRDTVCEFDPSLREAGYEFNGERLLIDLGLLLPSRFFPSKYFVKSYLRRYSANKLQRMLHKFGVYLAAIFRRSYLRKMGFHAAAGGAKAILVTRIEQLPVAASYVNLGAPWWFPQMRDFAAAHRARGGTVVEFVYDLSPVIYPEYFAPRESLAFNEWLNRSLDHATRAVCISEWTAKDLRKYAQAQGKAVTTQVVPLAHEFVGFDRTTRVTTPSSLVDLSRTEFVLCAGTIEFRKNNLAMLKIWTELANELTAPLPLLVFAGKYGKGSAEFQRALSQDARLAERVRVVHAPSDLNLAWLYQNCLFTAYPSQYEGWGLPVGEAAWFGKFCVASHVTSIPEVCGDLIDYVDPSNMGSIKAAVKRVLVDRDYLRERERAIASAELRTWSRVADEIYQSILSA